VLLLKQSECRVDGSTHLLAVPVPVGVVGEGDPQRFGDADVVHDVTTGFVPKRAVDPCDCLHEAGAAHGLVDVHGVH
jgi:hypothetical protein